MYRIRHTPSYRYYVEIDTLLRYTAIRLGRVYLCFDY